MSNKLYFERSALADEIAKELLGIDHGTPLTKLVVNPSSGTFLSAQRRTGKSTFMRLDFEPALLRHGVPVIYVDLWSDPKQDPGILIHEAVKDALKESEGPIGKFVRNSGLSKFSIAGAFSFDIQRVGKDITLAKALGELADKHQAKRVVLIVDEAQHALTTDLGQASMFALKAARDAMNLAGQPPKLLLVCTGSSRSKLGALVTGKESPFYGSRLRDFPMLGKDFAVWLCKRLQAQQPTLVGLDPEAVYRAFSVLGYRPEEMINTIGEAGFQRDPDEDINVVVATFANERHDQFMHELDQQFKALNPLQQLVLKRLVHMGELFSAYDNETLQHYTSMLSTDVTTAMVQNALESLVTREIVWKPKRGGYFIDDPLWNDWAEYNSRATQVA